MRAAAVRNLIFDLGGVILDLSVKDTLESFAHLSKLPERTVTEIFVSSPEFEQFETGHLTEHEFRDFIRSAYRIHASDQEIDTCWNAMLKGLPVAKLQLLTGLKTKYKTFLLSNTNTIHLRQINHVILKSVTGETSLDNYFHKTYYSQLMGMRKPDSAIFQHVLHENHLLADETLFLDDNASNVEAAHKLGIQTVFVTSYETIFDVFQS